jgi:DNA polymerase V
LISGELLDIVFHINGDMSARVMRTLARFTPDLEIYSIDEAFLGLSGFESRLIEHARELRRTVQRWTGISVSIGIAPTKTLAKVANRRAKRDPACAGVCTLMDEAAIDDALAGMDLTDLWGVASRLAARLRKLGIVDALALKHADPRFIRERLGVMLACSGRT